MNNTKDIIELNNVKDIIEIVPLYINDRLEYIDNVDYVIDTITANWAVIYKPRQVKLGSELPQPTDEIVAEAITVIPQQDGKYSLCIKVYDSLYYYKLKNPVIKINGTCIKNEDTGKLTITEIMRLSLADKGE